MCNPIMSRGRNAVAGQIAMKTLLTTFVLIFATTIDAADWTLNGGNGSRLPDGSLEVVGTGSGSNAWIGPQVRLEPGKTYRFKMEASSPTGGGGCAPCGPEGFSRDRPDITKEWKKFSYAFRVPKNREASRLRVGQWESMQTYRFRNIETVPVEPIPRGIRSTSDTNDWLRLGNGESVTDDVYIFNGWYDGEGSNDHRTLALQTAGFNSNRFTFGDENEIIYRFCLKPKRLDDKPTVDSDLPKPIPFLSGKVDVGVNYHVKGACIVEVRAINDHALPTEWTEIGRLDNVSSLSVDIPDKYFPAEFVFVRIRADKGAAFQVDTVGFEAKLEKERGFKGIGETVYADATANDTPFPNDYSVTPLFFDESLNLYVEHRNESDVAVTPMFVNPPNRLNPHSFLGPFDAQARKLPANSTAFEIKPKSSLSTTKIAMPGRTLEYTFPFNYYRDARFGYAISETLWWAEPDWKVSPTLPAPPKSEKKPIRIEAARNDFESFQLVVNGGKTGLDELSLSLDGNLQGDGDATISTENIQVRYAYYHFVNRPTDRTGLVGDWPDALPPLESPLKVAVGRNQPLWVTVYVPKDAKPGDYHGTLKLRRNGDESEVPFTVHVWNFSLPERNRHETAFGLSPGNIFRYHNCKTAEEKRAVLELYWRNFADHRVSVYNPTPLDPIRVSWNPKSDPPSATLDFTAFDKEMERRIREHHITNFNLRIEGMGWGTFEERHPGKIGEFVAGAPEYEAMFSDYVKKLEAHLTEKGWLSMAYVYWFDEPEPKDYDFVAEYTAKLKKYAPALARMITEEPNTPFIDAMKKANTSIDVWCPVSYCFNDDDAKKRQALGERFWWYVCTGPKEPFCTLFIDHPGTELRVWYWQAFQRKIVGSLVWESTYWTSATAFPNEAQNPYDDPMGYVAGGPPGSKRYWGNGDGRFVYPPLDAATPGRNDGKPILKSPVSSIRWEMIREGIEDYEMLLLLQDLKTKRPKLEEKIDTLLILPADITSSLTDFTKDPKPLYERRRRIAALIEQAE